MDNEIENEDCTIPLQDSHLSFEVIPERGGPEPVVEDGPDLVQLADHLVGPGVIEVTLGRYLVQSSPVLSLQLLENLLRTFLRFLALRKKYLYFHIF